MVEPVWKIISIFLALGAFLVTGGISLHSGQELIWVALKSVGAFFVCWIILCQLGAMLFMVIDKSNRQDLGSGSEDVAGSGS